MGRYTPHAPLIIGEEWVGIRDENLVFSPSDNEFEVGHQFTLTQSRIIRDVRFYINKYPELGVYGQTYFAAIYAQGTEHQSGPVKSVVLPVSGVTLAGAATVENTTSGVLALNSPSDTLYIAMLSSSTATVDCAFPFNSYPDLNGKRILAVNLLVSMAYVFEPQNVLLNVSIFGNTCDAFYAKPLVESGIQRIRLGDINHQWSGTCSNLTPERVPWRYTTFQRFEPAAGSALRIRFNTTAVPATFGANLFYVGLEVIYCEEQRLMVGGRIFGDNVLATLFTPYNEGVNIINMRSLASATTDPPLVAGDYTLTLTAGDPGDGLGTAFREPYNLVSFPPLNAVRETISLPGHFGKQIRTTTTLGEELTAETVHILPQLSIHTTGTGAPLNEVHVYGRSIAAPVYGAITATQTINDDDGAPARPFPQVRFYARRFGQGTASLLLSTTSPTIATSAITITPAELDALAEIVDGWKEVTARFPIIPTMGAIAGNPGWIFSSAASTAGTRYEVLGVMAPNVSGTSGSSITVVPAAQRLGPATYGAFGLGDQSDLTWMYQTTITPTTDDNTDAVLQFSTDMPTVSGIGVTQFSLTVTGIGQNCGITPACIPESILYHRISWTAILPASVPVTGFGYYELQRFDSEDNEWSTIMLAATESQSSFNDYEARVSIESQYRIRAINPLNFAGQWSNVVSNTLSSPGVGSSAQTGVLIFTSNSVQSGNNFLAYTELFDGEVLEPITFVEAGWQQLQPMYGKNFLTAFRSTERGGEQFSRTLLVQQAAVSGSLLDRAVVDLRDLAWNDLPYVCVRTEQGDRWYANVRVPSATFRRYRRLQTVEVQVTEVTDTPYAVDPGV